MRKSALGMGLVVAGVTVATMFGLEMLYGGEVEKTEKKGVTAEQVFSDAPPAKLDPSAAASSESAADTNFETQIRQLARVEATRVATQVAERVAQETVDAELY